MGISREMKEKNISCLVSCEKLYCNHLSYLSAKRTMRSKQCVLVFDGDAFITNHCKHFSCVLILQFVKFLYLSAANSVTVLLRWSFILWMQSCMQKKCRKNEKKVVYDKFLNFELFLEVIENMYRETCL